MRNVVVEGDSAAAGDFDNLSDLVEAIERMRIHWTAVHLGTAAVGNLLADNSPPHELCTRVVWIRDDIHPVEWERKAGEI